MHEIIYLGARQNMLGNPKVYKYMPNVLWIIMPSFNTLLCAEFSFLYHGGIETFVVWKRKCTIVLNMKNINIEIYILKIHYVYVYTNYNVYIYLKSS